MLSLPRSWERRQKIIQSISNSHVFLSYLLIWNWNDQYVHTLRSFLENHTWFQTKMGKVYTRFQTKTGQNPYPMAYIREYPPGVVVSILSFLLYGDFLRTTLSDPFYMDFHPGILRSILCGVQNRSGWRISSNKRLPHDDRVNVCLDHFWKKSKYSGWKLASKYKFWFFQLSFLGFCYSILNQ